MPITLVTGALDEKFTAIARELQGLRAGIDHIVVPGAGHNVALERPDSIASLLRSVAGHRPTR
jgi:pimeloyl-ACP methyl ester carboxylesterase